MKNFKFVLFTILMLLLFTNCYKEDNFFKDNLPISLRSEGDAVKFAPWLKLHHHEIYFPSDPEWFVDRVEMKFTRDGNDQNFLGAGAINSSNMNNRLMIEGSSSCRKHDEESGDNHRSNFFLQIPNGTQESTIRKGNSNLSELKILMNERIGPNGRTYIQYWFFYPYNHLCVGAPFAPYINNPYCASIAAHEGDWEHITIEFSGNQPNRVFMAAHDKEGKWYSTGEIQWSNDSGSSIGSLSTSRTHPIVYSAKGSHASYPEAKTYWRIGVTGGTAPDRTSNTGPSCKTWNNDNYYVQNGDFFGCGNITVPYWVKYSGYWGELGGWGPAGSWSKGNGPIGPAYKPEFFNGDIRETLTVRRSHKGGALSILNNDEQCNSFQTKGIIFYENDTNCDGNSWKMPVGKSFRGTVRIHCKNRWDWSNDEIRGVALSMVPKGTYIYLYDDGCGKTSDDWTRIYIKKDIEADEVIVINEGLEETHSNEYYSLTHSRDNGLLGKVSYIKVIRY